jgi:hybrid polyketide synthase / nonribosomal peptide synthetase ACE1
MRSIIQHAFIPQLSRLFQTEKIKQTNLDEIHFDELGVDSLLAVEIRSWFMKTFEVGNPVLKILNGATVSEIITLATETIPPRLVPYLHKVDSANQESDQGPASRNSIEEKLHTSTDSLASGSLSAISSPIESELSTLGMRRVEPVAPSGSTIKRSFDLLFTRMTN